MRSSADFPTSLPSSAVVVAGFSQRTLGMFAFQANFLLLYGISSTLRRPPLSASSWPTLGMSAIQCRLSNFSAVLGSCSCWLQSANFRNVTELGLVCSGFQAGFSVEVVSPELPRNGDLQSTFSAADSSLAILDASPPAFPGTAGSPWKCLTLEYFSVSVVQRYLR